jgi:hypothetical protein
MHPFHERLASVGLAALSEYGFALAGGYAVQAHGMLVRPSEDIDLFTTTDAEAEFPTAAAAAIHAYQRDGLDVTTLVDSPGFARLDVTDAAEKITARSSSASTGGNTRPPPSPSAQSSVPTTPSRTKSPRCTPAPGPRLHRRTRRTDLRSLFRTRPPQARRRTRPRLRTRRVRQHPAVAVRRDVNLGGQPAVICTHLPTCACRRVSVVMAVPPFGRSAEARTRAGPSPKPRAPLAGTSLPHSRRGGPPTRA